MTTWPDGPLLCGIDFSNDSRHAWLVASTLAQQLDRPLIVLTAIDPLLAEAGRATFGQKFVEEGASRDLATFLLQSAEARAESGSDDDPPVGRHTGAAGLGTKSFDFTTLVEVGLAADALVKAAHEHHASLIVVGTRGLGRTKRLFFGSTALKLLRTADRPVLAVPADENTPPGISGHRFSHVVCGVDFGESSLHAARVATDLGHRLSAPVTLVHAVAQIAVPETWDALAISAADQRVAEATSRLTELASTFDAVPPSVTVRVGEVAGVISEAGADHPSALIVLGLDGRDGHRPGTHAYRVLTEAKTPVMAVPRPT